MRLTLILTMGSLSCLWNCTSRTRVSFSVLSPTESSAGLSLNDVSLSVGYVFASSTDAFFNTSSCACNNAWWEKEKRNSLFKMQRMWKINVPMLYVNRHSCIKTHSSWELCEKLLNKWKLVSWQSHIPKYLTLSFGFSATFRAMEEHFISLKELPAVLDDQFTVISLHDLLLFNKKSLRILGGWTKARVYSHKHTLGRNDRLPDDQRKGQSH